MTLISYDAASHIKDLIDARSPFGSIWGLSSPLIITTITRTWKGRNKCRAIAKEKPWSRSICIRHLVPLDVWTRCRGALWLDGIGKAGILANAQSKSRLSPSPLHTLSHSVGGTRGQSTLLVGIVEEASTGGIFTKRKRTQQKLNYI